MRRIALFASLALAVGALSAACSGSSRGSTDSEAPEIAGGGVYLALGDSIAAGEGASDPESTDYVARIATSISEETGEAPDVQSLAVSGATTQDLIDGQLGPALERIEAGNVQLVTITIGGNDMFEYSADPDCVSDPVDPGCPLEEGLFDVEERLDRILGELREAAGETPVVINVYPQLFSGSGHDYERSAEKAFDLLNGVIATVAERTGVLLADPRPQFTQRSRDLTHIDEEPVDFHPNDTGYRVIADAFLNVLGLPDSGAAPL
jgi:lysophospholipase L1-like esterase